MPRLEELVSAVEGRAALYARRLDVDEEMVVGDVDASFPTGSAAKLLVLLTYAHLASTGAVDPSARREISADYRDARPGSGVLRHLHAGLAPTLEDCATLMMIVSDNVATDLLLDAVGGPEVVNATVARLGVGSAKVTSPTVWVFPPEQFGVASPRGLASAAQVLAGESAVAERCRTIMWRHQLREGFARWVPWKPDAVDFGLRSPLRLWSKAGSYPTVSCETGLFESDHATWVLSVMAQDLADWGNGSASAGPTLRASVSREVFKRWSGLSPQPIEGAG